LWNANGLAECENLFFFDWTLGLDVVVVGHQLAQIHVARQDRYLASIVEREFDGERDVSAVLNFLGHFAGGIDRQVLPAGGKC